MYEKVITSLNFVEREKEILKFWKENQVFEQTVERTKGKGLPTWTFYEGPPTANGMPHIGHILTRVVKDVFPRFWRMQGYDVLCKAGWDTHGLPVELEVEKQLGISGKPQIEEYGVEPFIMKCKESVWKYENEWRQMTERVGFWCDMDDPYITYKDDYIESVWWSLKRIWEKGLLYKGHKVVPYCPRCGTALSSHEVAQGYEDVTEESVTAKFKVTGKENEYILAWTTTPWTLPANVALCVNKNVMYVRAEKGGDVFILAEALAEKVLKEDYKILEKIKGDALVGMEYEPLLKFFDSDKKGWYVVEDDYVTVEDGTGIVHNACAYGEDDMRIGVKFDLPFIHTVNSEGKFHDFVTPWAGVFVKDADPLIIEHLKQTGQYYSSEMFTHSYPHCWRCHSPLLYYARNTWFIAMTKIRDNLCANNQSVNWFPDHIRNGRMGNFLENVIDWGLSRERYWGTPLPVWECECGHLHVIGGREELKSLSEDYPEELELHKPYIDAVHVKCEKCGGKMKRVPEVIDCWYDSGAMPFAQQHYPFENVDAFNTRYPADFITEAIDQTRGWFYSLIAISSLIFEDSCYKNCIVMGHVQDKDGRKMSKHLGNVVDPWVTLEKQGADAVRWYFYVNSAPWLPSRFYEDAVSEAQRKFMGTLWNTYAFYVLYANIDDFNPNEHKLEYGKLSTLDKWALSKLNTLVKNIEDGIKAYKITEPARLLQEYLLDISNWYVRRSRERFWAKGMEQDKVNAYMTLYTVLNTFIQIASPFIPFMTELIYQNIVRRVDNSAPVSLHLRPWPKYDEHMVNMDLEKNMDAALKIVVAGRAARNFANIKNRQPLSLMYIKSDVMLPDEYMEIVKEELNVREAEYRDDVGEFISYKFKPQLRTLGPKYGKLLPKIGAYLQEMSGNALMAELKRDGKLYFVLEKTQIELYEDDLLIEIGQADGFAAQEDGNVAVALATTLTDELIEEGFVRELISKIQTMRKEAGFEVMDRIDIYFRGTDKIKEIFELNMEELKEETLSDNIIEGTCEGYSRAWDINGEKTELGVVKK